MSNIINRTSRAKRRFSKRNARKQSPAQRISTNQNPKERSFLIDPNGLNVYGHFEFQNDPTRNFTVVYAFGMYKDIRQAIQESVNDFVGYSPAVAEAKKFAVSMCELSSTNRGSEEIALKILNSYCPILDEAAKDPAGHNKLKLIGGMIMRLSHLNSGGYEKGIKRYRFVFDKNLVLVQFQASDVE